MGCKSSHVYAPPMARALVTRPLPDGWLDPLLTAGHDAEYLADDLLEQVFERDDSRGAAVLDETTADLAFLLLLAAARRSSDAEATLRNGEWHGFRIDAFLGVDVHGATLGIVGFGRIGQAMARRASGFGMNVLHHSRQDTGREGYVADLDDLLARVDAVSLHVPLTDETRGLIDARRLRLMRSHAVLVNTARGPVVDEEALAVALEDGVIFAAGIDVYEREPEVHPLLLAAPHTVLLPHIGSASEATRRRMGRLACSGAVAVLAGEQPPNLIKP
jgi:glyoxylate reductase